jgi:hypothetical protein
MTRKNLRRVPRTDLVYKLFVYCTRESDVFVRREAMKKSSSLSRVVDDIIKEARLRARKNNVDVDEQSESVSEQNI